MNTTKDKYYWHASCNTESSSRSSELIHKNQYYDLAVSKNMPTMVYNLISETITSSGKWHCNISLIIHNIIHAILGESLSILWLWQNTCIHVYCSVRIASFCKHIDLTLPIWPGMVTNICFASAFWALINVGCFVYIISSDTSQFHRTRHGNRYFATTMVTFIICTDVFQVSSITA